MILARPTISTYLARTLTELGVTTVVGDDGVVPMRPALRIRSLREFAADPKAAYGSLLLTSSENALAYLYDVIPYDDRVMKARLFKDKAAFRRAIAKRFPAFFFREVRPEELDSIDAAGLPYPVVLKPSIGISSIGVVRVGSAGEWAQAVAFLREELESYQRNYSRHVVEKSGQVLLESYIEGRELAIDGYFNAQAEPVVLNIMEHLFSRPSDTSDRLYVTRRSLMERYLPQVTAFLREFGEVFDLKRFPFNLEVRVNEAGELIPIELNPLRFSGLGTTEIAQYAYGINVYEAFFTESKPDWKALLAREDDSIYAFLCVEVPTALYRDPALRIADREVFKQFSEVLEYRILDERETSTFAVIFMRTENEAECRRLLDLDLGPFFRRG